MESKSLLTKPPIAHLSPPIPLPQLPIEDFIPDEIYELCDVTPAELAAAAILRKYHRPRG